MPQFDDVPYFADMARTPHMWYIFKTTVECKVSFLNLKKKYHLWNILNLKRNQYNSLFFIFDARCVIFRLPWQELPSIKFCVQICIKRNIKEVSSKVGSYGR